MANAPRVSGDGHALEEVARAVHLGSARTLRRLREIAKRAPELLQTVDRGAKTIGGAFAELRRFDKLRKHTAQARRVQPRADVVLGDCRDILPTFAAERFAGIFTDAPYGVSTEGRTLVRRDAGNLAGDFGRWDQLLASNGRELIASCAREFLRVLRPGGVVYLFTGDRLLADWVMALREAGFEFPMPCLLAWQKSNPAPKVRKCGWRALWEQIVFVRKRGRDAFNYLGDDEMGNVLRFPSPRSPARIHPTEKPVALLERLIRVSTNPGDEVLDPFAGSGSTGEAALRAGRHSVLIERDRVFHGLATARIHQVESQVNSARSAGGAP